MSEHGITARLQAIADDAGIDLRLHARVLDGRGDAVSVGLFSDVATPMASLYKVPLLAAWCDLVASGEVDPRECLHLAGRDRFAGPTGVATLVDDVVLSQRDAARLAINVSDNTCADALLDVVGIERVNDWLRERSLGLVVVRRGSMASLTRIMNEFGADSPDAALSELAAFDRDVATSEYDPALAGSATARSLTAVLAQVWTLPSYQLLREAMAQQAWRHRIGSGFPHDDVSVAGKTGSLGHLRHEMAVVEYPFELPVAVAIMTRAWRPEVHQPRIDRAIGELAHLAVSHLRRGVRIA